MTADLREEIEKAATLVVKAKHLVAVVGAGMSVESGIPPFRGPGGLWTKYGEPPMDGYQRFLADPKGWWETYQQATYRRELDAAIREAKPNPGHYALAELEAMGILKHIITQNVDNLHQIAGSQKVAEIHGNRYKLRCIGCNARFEREKFQITELPPHCPKCEGIVKGDGVMFGEPIPADTLETCEAEAYACDCMMLIGTSGTVYPAASFPQMVERRGGSLIEVNLYETSLTHMCVAVLRGPSGESLPLLVERVKAFLRY
ncbi:MAG: NAD-dependent deacylase [Chloroflexi bacterium]|nr:NAD-dependent deacylase [Chloroflexota bacterium]